ncbi:hypothetical protein RB2654_14745 [Rhodobacterales bacterium HTCC2654]|uniref:Uncharacterized protein n=1 Tax=Maritimibacter alkaliphilus HTCC2654 TaxID=314271 RepID=A3VGZ8_9RHOB|nr:hypothetical protein RB2654_14745 [Rhodobacterales bacterium HTCC2654] [Maritimibacter alkaliphilus HTCC2654]
MWTTSRRCLPRPSPNRDRAASTTSAMTRPRRRRMSSHMRQTCLGNLFRFRRISRMRT